MMHIRQLSLFITILFLWITPSITQELPPCGEREFLVEFPRLSPIDWCIELPMPEENSASRRLTSIVIADGILYATNPYDGEVVALIDSDGDMLPDTETIIATGLIYPNGIELHDGMLYVLGVTHIYRISIDSGVVDTLVDDLPGGRGFIPKGILIFDNNIFIGFPASCDFCEPDHPFLGTVIRMNLDGTDKEVVAHGLRFPADLEIYQGNLWVTDIGRDDYGAGTFLDEINKININSPETPHFGFPYCIGEHNDPDPALESDFDCSIATTPIVTFHTKSTPISLERFDSDKTSPLTGQLLVALSGSSNSSFIAGHVLLALDALENSFAFETIVPVDTSTTLLSPNWVQTDAYDIVMQNAEHVNNQAGGIYPHFIYDVAVGSEGWIYLSVQGKGIYVLRPR